MIQPWRTSACRDDMNVVVMGFVIGLTLFVAAFLYFT